MLIWAKSLKLLVKDCIYNPHIFLKGPILNISLICSHPNHNLNQTLPHMYFLYQTKLIFYDKFNNYNYSVILMLHLWLVESFVFFFSPHFSEAPFKNLLLNVYLRFYSYKHYYLVNMLLKKNNAKWLEKLKIHQKQERQSYNLNWIGINRRKEHNILFLNKVNQDVWFQ